MSQSELVTIDLSPFTRDQHTCLSSTKLATIQGETSDLSSQQATGHKLVRALHETGFVYIKNHGLPASTVQEAFRWSKKFFDLSQEDKMKAPHPPGWAVHRGYSWPGLEKVSNETSKLSVPATAASLQDDEVGSESVVDVNSGSDGHGIGVSPRGEEISGSVANGSGGDHEEDPDVEMAKLLRQSQDFKESYEIGSDDFSEMPNIWPPDDIIPGWQTFMRRFYWECFEVCFNILKALSQGLGLDDDQATTFIQVHSGLNGQLRLLHYPPIPADDILKGKFARMPAHSDWSSLTILFQDDCGGLEVEKPQKPGEFIEVAPVEETLILNVGDLLMRWSNDYLKSTQHRVSLPPLQDRFTGTQRLSRARYSIPFFMSPDPDALVSCFDLGLDLEVDAGRSGDNPTGTPKYKPITPREYGAMRARMQYQ